VTPTAGQRAGALAAKHHLYGGDFPSRWAAEFEADIAAAIREAEAAVRDEDCRAICPHCRDGVPVVRGIGPGVRYHDDDLGSPCVAGAIHDLQSEAP
jgi:hypothetical protein